MLNNITIIFILSNVIVDFYLAPSILIDTKQTARRLFLEILIYFSAMFLTSLLFCLLTRKWQLALSVISLCCMKAALRIVLLHLRRNNQIRESLLYFGEHFISIALIITLIEVTLYSHHSYTDVLPLSIYNYDVSQTTRWILLFFLILRPANETLKHTLSKYEIDEPTSQIVGKLERLLYAAMIYLNQYTTVGIIFAAKSFSRSKKVESDPLFAEYYLIGTLYSILFVVACYLLVVKTL